MKYFAKEAVKRMVVLKSLVLIGMIGWMSQSIAQDSGGLALTIRISQPGVEVVSSAAYGQMTIQNALSQGVIFNAAPESSDVTVVSSTRTRAAATPPRHIQLSADQIIIRMQDETGKEIYRSAKTDPRLLRAEVTDNVGELQMRRFYLADATLNIVVPRITGADSLDILKPIWDGQEFQLRRLSRLDIGNL